MGHAPEPPMKADSERCRMVMNNMNKNTSAKILQPDQPTGFKQPEKPTEFLIRALRTCKRATLES